jgi:polysaccharide export outer membrane protein
VRNGRVGGRRTPASGILVLLSSALVVAGCATHRGVGAPNPPTEEAGAVVAAAPETVLVLAHPPKAEELPLPPILTEPYRISTNDVLTVHVLANPGLTTQVRVRPDGIISVPGIGEIVAEDREPAELAKEIERDLSKLILEPQVTVIVDDFGPFLVYVLGEVQRAGSIEARRDMTVLGAIAAAGGTTNAAKMGSVVLIRRLEEGQAMAVKLDLSGPLEGLHLENDVPVRMYDIVVVPKTFIAKFDLFMSRFFGSVQRPLDLYQRGWEAFNNDRVYPVRVVTVTR